MVGHRRMPTIDEETTLQVNQRNLIMDDLSHVSDDSTPLHPRDLRHYVLRDRETHRAFNGKIEIPEFEGKMQPDEFIEWLNTVDRIFQYQQVPEHRKVEKQQKKIRSRCSKYSSREGFANRGSTSSPKPTAATKTNTKVSTSKGESVVSKQQQQPSPSNINSHRCFKCQGFGHIASECPNCRIVSLVEEENDEEMEEDLKADKYNDQEEDEEMTYADHVKTVNPEPKDVDGNASLDDNCDNA
ncbi:hypothetical protein LWI28_018419 [Acer negundo]|uniref:CCHC-type domain-containing protein n=1 Tax=Acer negundo TaxID=4023 RepID=A0AAD5IQP7_ACENE|nr:hypothetical protein LWI28_018419 [Acer negundo]